jgi:hypothetical protein
MSAWLGQAVHLATVAAPSPSPSPGQGGGTTPVQTWTLIVAGLAVVATLVTAFFARRTGKGQVEAAKQAADASERSAEAADKSAQAAQEAVGVNRDTAAGVAERAHADSLSQRYQDAAAQLGHEKAPVRLAGVYAMARLADDWSDQRQACIDVLCAYLRMPWPDRGESEEGELQVRRSIVKLMGNHLNPDTQTPWSAMDFNFEGADLRQFDLANAKFAGRVSFNRATFGEKCVLRQIVFERAWFYAVSVSGSLFLEGLTATGSLHRTVGWEGFEVAARGSLWVLAENDWPGGHLSFYDGKIEGSFRLSFGVQAPKTTIDVRDLEILEGGEFVLENSGNYVYDPTQWPTVSVKKWKLRSGAKAHIDKYVNEAKRVTWDEPGLDKGAELTIDPW